MKSALVLALLLAQTPAPVTQMPRMPPLTPEQMQRPMQVPVPQQPQTPQNLKNWPRSCQRLHLEVNRCEQGERSCNRKRVDYWRKQCAHDERGAASPRRQRHTGRMGSPHATAAGITSVAVEPRDW